MKLLEEQLYKIKIEGNVYVIPQLLKNKEIELIVYGICKRFKVKKVLVDKLLQNYIIESYVYSELFTIERFKNEIVKYLGRKVCEINGKQQRRKENMY
jgi:hypothetical protein